MSSSKKAPIRPQKLGPDVALATYRRGTRYPQAIAWFGARSFWGHLWHLAASVIATEDIDSRDWMRPDAPRDLTRTIAEVLHAKHDAPTLTEAIDSDLWIDFVADTGDDASVSGAVARLLFERYEVPDPDGNATSLVLPRGHMLMFGGDTAYPVATDLEIHNRVIVPWNAVLRKAHDGKERALIGIPGNHDWFAGLDGFGRMFRRRRGRIDRASTASVDEIDRFGQIGHFVHWIEAFRIGRLVVKRAALPLEGYTPVQSASYWALHLAPALDLWGVDRQLRSVDFQQRMFFEDARDHECGKIIVIPDPVHAFLEPNPPGVEIMNALDVSLEGDRVLILAGDTHHYCREQIGNSVHVTAGGGGAFLHPARIHRDGMKAPDAEFPGPRASLSLTLRIPWLMANGRSGFLVHVFFALVYLPTYSLDVYLRSARISPSAVTAIVAAIVCLLVGGWRRSAAFRIGGLAAITGVAIGFLPLVIESVAAAMLGRLGIPVLGSWSLFIQYGIAVYFAVVIAGFFLMAITVLGLEHHQAFGALAHPGYKHFVRLRIKKDGSLVDAWAIGKADPLSRDDKVVIIDHFRWKNPHASIEKPPQKS